MRIAIIADPIDEQSAGIHYYTKHLLSKLLELDEENEYILIHSEKNDFFNNLIEGRRAPTKEVVVPGYRRLPGWPSLRKFFILPFVFRKFKPDVVFEPAHIGPFSFFWKCRKIVTINDLTPIIFPQHHIWISRVVHKKMLPWVVKNADGIIAPSISTKMDVEKFYGEQGEKIKVIYDAAADTLKPVDASVVEKMRQKYAIKKPYILSVGTVEPRKNLEILLKSFRALRAGGIDFSWVIVGEKGWYYEDFLKQLEGDDFGKDIIVTGYVPEGDLAALYTGALTMVYPSMYEGFGLPPLEAMQCGCPVICSRNSSLPEVVGDAAITFNPTDFEALKTALRTLLENENIRDEMSGAGIIQAKKFSWEKCAKETLDFFCKSL